MLVGVNGQLGSGKDTFHQRAEKLAAGGVVKVEGRIERRAFADKLKQAVAALFGITLEFQERAKRDDTTLVQIRELRFRVSRVRGLGWTRHLPGFERIVVSQTMRLTLQRMGTEVGRDIFGKTFWVDQCIPEGIDHSGKTIIVTDPRFPNEIERIRGNGGSMVRVHGPVADNGDNHPSEQRIDDSLIDFEVDNSIRNDGFASLNSQVQDVFHRIQEAPAAEERRQVVHAKRAVSPVLDITQRLPRPGRIGTDVDE